MSHRASLSTARGIHLWNCWNVVCTACIILYSSRNKNTTTMKKTVDTKSHNHSINAHSSVYCTFLITCWHHSWFLIGMALSFQIVTMHTQLLYRCSVLNIMNEDNWITSISMRVLKYPNGRYALAMSVRACRQPLHVQTMMLGCVRRGKQDFI